MVNRQFWKERSVFVTGHTGFKGAWLSAWLTHLGASLSGFSKAPETEPSLHGLAAPPSGTSTIGDIRDAAALDAAMADARPEVVFHLAAQALVRRSYVDPVETYATNVMGTVNLLEAVRRSPTVRAVVVVTSDKCYDNAERGEAFVETDPLGGHDPYSNSKACCELVTAAYRSSFFRDAAVKCASARAGNVIGGGDWSADRLIPDIIRARTGGPALAIRSPDAVRPWQHVLEPLHGYLLLAEALAGSDHPDDFATAWNFGPDLDACLAVRQIIGRIAPALPFDRTSAATAMPEAHVLRIDSTRARNRLGWRPQLSIDAALDWTSEWYARFAKGEEAARLLAEQIDAYELLLPRPEATPVARPAPG